MVRKTTENTEGHREKKQWLSVSSVSSVVNFLCHDSFHPNILKSLIYVVINKNKGFVITAYITDRIKEGIQIWIR